jgi:hypothetical protein
MNRLDALLLLCDCVSSWNNSRDQVETLRNKLLSGNIRWEHLVEAANQHLLCPALYGALKHKGLLSSIPTDLREYLQTLNDHNGERNGRLADHAEETIHFLNELSVEPVLLKGTANLLSGLYLDQSMRFISDIDMLIPENRMIDCIRKLNDSGYHFLGPHEADRWKTHHHCAPLIKRNSNFQIELHRELVHKQHRPLIDASSVLKDSVCLKIGMANARIPSLSHRIIHNAVHAQLTDRSYSSGIIQLRQLYDLVLLADKMTDEEEWRSIFTRFRRLGYLSELSGYFLAGKYFWGISPSRLIPQSIGARFYLAGLCAQAEHLWLMRLGNIARFAKFYGGRFKHRLESRKIPRIFNHTIRQNHYHQMFVMLNRNW